MSSRLAREYEGHQVVNPGPSGGGGGSKGHNGLMRERTNKSKKVRVVVNITEVDTCGMPDASLRSRPAGSSGAALDQTMGPVKPKEKGRGDDGLPLIGGSPSAREQDEKEELTAAICVEVKGLLKTYESRPLQIQLVGDGQALN